MELSNLPKDIAIIMDGNGRWAKKRNLPRTAGHLAGSENVRTIAKVANRLNIRSLTLYAFSTENWSRPEKEIEYLCKLPKMFFNKYMNELNKMNIRVTCIGEYHKFPKETVDIIENAILQTSKNTGLNLCLAVNYGSRREIVLAANAFAKDYAKNNIECDESMFEKYLMSESPNVDLLIRTSGEVRLSNYLLWQVAYAEMVFTPLSWPDLDENAFISCIEEFQKRTRRFGGLEDEN